MSVTERALDRYVNCIPRWLRWIGTYLTVSILWLLFRADSIAQWWDMVVRMLRMTRGEKSVYIGTWLCRISNRLVGYLPVALSGAIVFEMILAVYVLILIVVCLLGRNMSERKKEHGRSLQAIGYALVAVMLVLSLGAETEFIYFNF